MKPVPGKKEEKTIPVPGAGEDAPAVAEAENKPKKAKRNRAWFAARFGKNAFWIWVGYQAIKGTLTTTFIWAPIIYAWLHHQ